MKLFNMLISTVKTGILSINVWNIEGTYFTSDIFSFWQCESIQYCVKTGILSLIVWNIEGTYFTSSMFSFWQWNYSMFISSVKTGILRLFETLRGPISPCFYLDKWNYSTCLFKCKTWCFKFKCLRHLGDLFHF